MGNHRKDIEIQLLSLKIWLKEDRLKKLPGPLFNRIQVNQFCYTSKVLEEGKKGMVNRIATRKLVHMITEDLVVACKDSTKT